MINIINIINNNNANQNTCYICTEGERLTNSFSNYYNFPPPLLDIGERAEISP